MTEMTAYGPGQFCWVDLMAHDVTAAKAFYGGLLGWAAEDQETGGPPYVVFRRDGKPVAGMGEMDDATKGAEVPPVWSSYVFAVDDIGAATGRVSELGGTVMRPPFEVPVGHVAVAADSQGAHFALIELTVPAD